MTDYGFQFIVERIIKNANDSLNEAKENHNNSYYKDI